jgi:hypothetical protein
VILSSFSDASCGGNYCTVVNIYNAKTGTWKLESSGQPVPGECGGDCFGVGSLSCGSPVNCMEFSGYGNLAWTGGKLTPAPSVSAGRGSDLGAVSCGRTYCLAVGHRIVAGVAGTLAERWNGKSWVILATPDV